jgi:hypothetical protein
MAKCSCNWSDYFSALLVWCVGTNQRRYGRSLGTPNADKVIEVNVGKGGMAIEIHSNVI